MLKSKSEMTAWLLIIFFFSCVPAITKVGQTTPPYRMVTDISRTDCWKTGGCEIELYGWGFLFDSWYGENQVFFGTHKAEVIRYKSNGNKLTVKTPAFSIYTASHFYLDITVRVQDINTNIEVLWSQDWQRRFRFNNPWQSMPVPYVAEALDSTQIIFAYEFYNGLDDIREIKYHSQTLTDKYPGAEGLQCDYVSDEINVNWWALETEDRAYEDKSEMFATHRILCQPPEDFAAGHYLIKTQSVYGYTHPVYTNLGYDTFYAVEHNRSFAYNYEVYPVIEDISPRVVGTLGGAQITITGTGFDTIKEFNVVKINDQPCEVLEASTSQIICIVPAQDEVGSTMQSYRGLSIKNQGCIELITNETIQFFNQEDYNIFNQDHGAADQRFNLSMNTACDPIYQEDVWLSVANRMFRHYNAYTLFDVNDHLRLAYRWLEDPNDPDSRCWLRANDDMDAWWSHHDHRSVSQAWRSRFCDKNTGNSMTVGPVEDMPGQLDTEEWYDYHGWKNRSAEGWYDRPATRRFPAVNEGHCIAICNDFPTCVAVNFCKFECSLFHETADLCPECWTPFEDSPTGYCEHFERESANTLDEMTAPTCGGTSGGYACEFPFYHKGVEYTSCTTDDSDSGRPWCKTWHDGYSMTSIDQERVFGWGFCDCFHEHTYQVDFLTSFTGSVELTFVGENGGAVSKTITPSDYNFITASGIGSLVDVKATFTDAISGAVRIQLYNEISFDAQTYVFAGVSANTEVTLMPATYNHNYKDDNECVFDIGECSHPGILIADSGAFWRQQQDTVCSVHSTSTDYGTVENRAECANACLDHTDCNVFSYDSSAKHCFLYTGCTETAADDTGAYDTYTLYDAVQSDDTITTADECFAWCTAQPNWDSTDATCDWRTDEGCWLHSNVWISSSTSGNNFLEDWRIEGRCWFGRKCTSYDWLMREERREPHFEWRWTDLNNMTDIWNGDFRLIVETTHDIDASRALDFYINGRPGKPLDDGGFGCRDYDRYTFTEMVCYMGDGVHYWQDRFLLPKTLYMEPSRQNRTFIVRRTAHGRMVSIYQDGRFYGSANFPGVSGDIAMFVRDVWFQFHDFKGVVHRLGVEPLEPVAIDDRELHIPVENDLLWQDSQAHQFEWSENTTWLNESDNTDDDWFHGPFDYYSLNDGGNDGGGYVHISVELDMTGYTHVEFAFRIWFLDTVDSNEIIKFQLEGEFLYERQRSGNYILNVFDGPGIPNPRGGDRIADKMYEDCVVRVPLTESGVQTFNFAIGITRISHGAWDESWGFNRVKIYGVIEHDMPETFVHPDATGEIITVDLFARDDGDRAAYMRINDQNDTVFETVEHYNKGTYLVVIDQYSGKLMHDPMRFNFNGITQFINHVAEGRIVAMIQTDWAAHFCFWDMWSPGEADREKSCGEGSGYHWRNEGGLRFCDIDQSPWSQINLDRERVVYGLYLLGSGAPGEDEWVTSFTVSLSSDGENWTWADDEHVFLGSYNKDQGMTIMFQKATWAQHVRIYPQTWNNHPTIRWGVYYHCNKDAYQFPFAEIGLPFPHTFEIWKPQVMVGRKGGNDNGLYPWISNDIESLFVEIPVISGGREVFIEIHTPLHMHARTDDRIYYMLINDAGDTYPDILTADPGTDLNSDVWYNKTYFIPETFGEVTAVHFIMTGDDQYRCDLVYVDGVEFDVGAGVKISSYESNRYWRAEHTVRRQVPFVQTISEFFYYTSTDGEEGIIETWFVPKASGEWTFTYHTSAADSYVQYAPDSTDPRDLIYPDSSTKHSMNVTEGVPTLIRVHFMCERHDYMCFFELSSLDAPVDSGIRPLPNPVSLEFFQTPIRTESEQVLLTINGMDAFCRDEEECKLEYSDDAAPTVTSFTPTTVVAGEDIVISGTRFDETTSASILGTTMNCTLDDAETITCGAPSIASGVHELIVMNRAFGRAVPSTSMDITVTMDMTAVYPTQGSTEGGTLLVITGSGFGDPDNIQITIGGNPCPLYEFTDNYCVTTNTCEPKPVISYESLTCVAPASTGGRRELSAVDVEITLNGLTQTLSSAYEYSSDVTPRIDSISPEFGTPGTFVTITGENFEQSVGELPEGWYIDRFGFQHFYSRVMAFIDDIPCSVSEYTDTEIRCQVFRPGLEDTNLAVSVELWNVGKAENPTNVQFSFGRSVSSLERNKGSFYGGQKLILHGAGFQPILENNEVTIGDDLSCTPTDVSDTLDWLECEVPPYSNLPGVIAADCYKTLDMSNFNLTSGCEEAAPVRRRLRLESCYSATWSYSLSADPTRAKITVNHRSDESDTRDKDDFTSFYFNGQLIGQVFNSDYCGSACTAEFPIGSDEGELLIISHSTSDERDLHMYIETVSTSCYIPGKIVSPVTAGKYTRLRFNRNNVNSVTQNNQEIISAAAAPNVCTRVSTFTDCYVSVKRKYIHFFRKYFHFDEIEVSDGDTFSPNPVSAYDPGHIGKLE